MFFIFVPNSFFVLLLLFFPLSLFFPCFYSLGLFILLFFTRDFSLSCTKKADFSCDILTEVISLISGLGYNQGRTSFPLVSISVIILYVNLTSILLLSINLTLFQSYVKTQQIPNHRKHHIKQHPHDKFYRLLHHSI